MTLYFKTWQKNKIIELHMNSNLKEAPTIPSALKKEISNLQKLWKPVLEAEKNLAKKELEFGYGLYKLYEEAKAIDYELGGDDYIRFVKQEVNKLVGTDNKSIISRWQKIGEYHDILIKYSTDLPASRDFLYNSALAIEKKKPFDKWVAEKLITPDTSFRDLKKLTNNATRRKSKSISQRNTNVSITFSSSSHQIALDILDIIRSEDSILINAEKGVKEELKALLKEEYEQYKYKFK